MRILAIYKTEDGIEIRGEHATYYLSDDDVERVLMNEELMCEMCADSGELSVDHSDEGNIMRGVGTQKCVCRL